MRGLFACQAEQRNLVLESDAPGWRKALKGNTLSGFVCLQVSAGCCDQGVDIHSPLVYSGLSFFQELCSFLGVTENEAMLALNAALADGRLLQWNFLLQTVGAKVEVLQPHLFIAVARKHQVGSSLYL